jgi:hypothetical protein
MQAPPRTREIEDSTMPFPNKGDRVVQPNYGAGTIVEMDVYHTVIDFDAHGLRRFITNRVVLEPTSEAAPAKRARKTRKSPAKS